MQILVSTQSPALVDYFEPEQILVAERTDHGSEFRRLDSAALEEWMETYSLGELWEKPGVKPRAIVGDREDQRLGAGGRPRLAYVTARQSADDASFTMRSASTRPRWRSRRGRI